MSADTITRWGRGYDVHGQDGSGVHHAHPPDDEDRLEAAIAGLTLLTVDPLRFEEVLIGVAQLCQQAVPGADGTGLRVLRAAPPHTVVGSSGLARELTTIQHRLDEGPCITAVTEARVVRCDPLSPQHPWPRFRQAARRLEVQSVLSLPLGLADLVLGSISVHARGPGAFDERAVAAAERFSSAAAVTVRNAQLLASAQRMSAVWWISDAARLEIDQALAIIISRTGGSPSQAFEQLLVMSQRAHQRVSAVAAQVVDDAAPGAPVGTSPSLRRAAASL